MSVTCGDGRASRTGIMAIRVPALLYLMFVRVCAGWSPGVDRAGAELYSWLYGGSLPPAGAYRGIDCLTGPRSAATRWPG
jgi:hypothetical protein